MPWALVMEARAEGEAAPSGPGGPRGGRNGSVSLRKVVRVAQRVLRPDLWSSFEITDTGDSVSLRVHRVPAAALPATPRPTPVYVFRQATAPGIPTKWEDMTRKQKKGIMAQRRGMLMRFAVRGVLSPSHPLRRWTMFRERMEAVAAARAADVAMESETTHTPEKNDSTAPAPATTSTKRGSESPDAGGQRRPGKPGGLARGFTQAAPGGGSSSGGGNPWAVMASSSVIPRGPGETWPAAPPKE